MYIGQVSSICGADFAEVNAIGSPKDRAGLACYYACAFAAKEQWQQLEWGNRD